MESPTTNYIAICATVRFFAVNACLLIVIEKRLNTKKRKAADKSN